MQKIRITPTAIAVTVSLLSVAAPLMAASYPVCLAGGADNSMRCEFANFQQCRASASGGVGYCVTNPAINSAANGKSKDPSLASGQANDMAAMPWPAPVGHRQPRASDLSKDVEFEPGSRWLDHELNQKLKICRGC
jgi:Protein of unknown function (DUF3551)